MERKIMDVLHRIADSIAGKATTRTTECAVYGVFWV